MHVWRISNHADLSGRGGFLADGRWHRKGVSVVYCADHPSSTLLEMLVHVDPEDVPASFQLLMINLPDDVAVVQPDLPTNWADQNAVTQALGMDFLQNTPGPAMRVPSALVPFAWNYILNPGTMERSGIRIVGVSRHPIDRRLLGLR
ncbi:RES domain-containing protein [Aquibium carbonis]|uniref:RES domain-containing protein n=1 Tax=Aquibium carbonis TaxID=2495581 RepID=A0A429YZW4_9HYPH|nr:RES family NAD+ phosphorylase [Aquibium carbonis]RST87012.1 RES domain-containing protein [Aquibium carbonis]